VDALGDHYSACMRTGRVQAHAKPVERAWERVLKEAGASVNFQHLVQNTMLLCDPRDWRQVDVLATGSSLFRGRAVFCDATLRPPLKGNGAPQPHAARQDGATFRDAEREKKTKYSDVESSPLMLWRS